LIHDVRTARNNSDEENRRRTSDSFPIANRTKIKLKGTDWEQGQHFGFEKRDDNDSIRIGIDDYNENSVSKNGDNKSYISLEKVTQDLLDFNETAGSWRQQECDKVVNLIKLWSKRTGGSGRPEPAVQQELLLRRVIEEKHAANAHALDLNMRDIYHEIIFSWSKSHETGSTRRAEEILDAMQDAEDRDIRPAIDAWNSVLGSYVQSKIKDAPDHAVRVFNKLYCLISQDQTDARPNEDSYVHILKAVASKGDLDAPKNVLDLLVRMENLAENGFSIDVTAGCHNVYLSSLIESMKDSRVSATKTARLAESYLRRMKENPDANSKPDRRSMYRY
jgi:hypothetical protein